MKTIKLIAIALLFTMKATQAQTSMSVIEATYIYNFAAQIEWPEAYRSGDFVIYVLGNSDVYSELLKIAETKKVGTQKLVVKRISSATGIDKCHLIFISKQESSIIARVLESTSNYSTLIVGENEGLCREGAGVNFVIRNDKINFEMSKNNMNKRGLKSTAILLKLAIMID